MKAEQLTDVWVDMLNGDVLTLTPAGDIDRLPRGLPLGTFAG